MTLGGALIAPNTPVVDAQQQALEQPPVDACHDAELDRLLAVWPTLPERIRAAIILLAGP